MRGQKICQITISLKKDVGYEKKIIFACCKLQKLKLT